MQDISTQDVSSMELIYHLFSPFRTYLVSAILILIVIAAIAVIGKRANNYRRRGSKGASHVREDLADALQDSAPSPQGADALDTRIVNILFATNRQFSTDHHIVFTGERSSDLTFGSARVRVPERHRYGRLEKPLKLRLITLTLYEQKIDPGKHFQLIKIGVSDRESWQKEIARSGANSALVFVHGFNTPFEDALIRFGQICWDLQVQSIPLLFSWPSRGGMLQYVYDHVSAMLSTDHFIEFLLTVKEQHNIKRIHILAHSMGNQVVLNALANHRHENAPLGLAEVMMAAPDVDADVYRGLATKTRPFTRGMTLYASSRDKALVASRKIAGDKRRAGDCDREGPVLVTGVDAIDVTRLGEEMLGLNHGVFAENRSILNDVSIVMKSGRRPPHRRLTDIRAMPEGSSTPTHWRFE